MRGRVTAAVVVLALVDLLVLVLGYRAHGGWLPPFQRTDASFKLSQSPSADPSAAPADLGITAPVLLGVNPSGVVLRATRGACQTFRDNPARVWVGSVDATTAPAPVDPGVSEVLGLMVYADGSMRVTGLDEACRAMTVDSKDGGATWQPTQDAGIWRLPADTTESSVTGPRGQKQTTQCAPTQLLNLPGRRGIASCARGTFFPLVPGRQPDNLSVGDFSELSVAPGADERHYFVLGSTPDCEAQVADVQVSASSVTNLECLAEDPRDPSGTNLRAPLAIATTADLVVVQVGNDLMVSHHGGNDFATVGPADEPSDAAS